MIQRIDPQNTPSRLPTMADTPCSPTYRRSDGRRAVLLSKLRSPKYEAEYSAAERSLREAGLVDDLTGAG